MKKLSTLIVALLILSVTVFAERKALETGVPLFSLFSALNTSSNEDVRSGIIVGLNRFGDTAYVSGVRKSQLNGNWRSWYPTRIPCDSGRLVKNIPDGEWKGWYANGQVRFVYHFNARKLAALKEELRRQPKTRFYHIATKSPEIAASYYNAERIFGHKSSSRSSVFLSKQINHKPREVSHLTQIVEKNTDVNDDVAYLPPFTEALLHGNFTEYYESGKVKKTGVYLNGLREGMWEEYTTAGIKAVGTYHHGLPNGEWRYYDETGKLLKWKRFDHRGKVSEEYDFDKRNRYSKS
jgi:antitoxin component YwqK of YwqJK toxin-antitoxin module